MDDGTGDGDTLFLTAGEFSGTVVEAVGEADEVEGGLGADAAFGAGEFGEEEGEFDVFEGAEDGDEVVELEDVADVFGAPLGELGAGEVGDVAVVDFEVTGGGGVDAGDEVEEGCFS